MRDSIAGLTPRGRAVTGAGVALVALAWLLGQRDLLRVAVLALALPLIAAALISRTRFRLTSSRGVASRRVALGDSTVSLVRVTNSSRLPMGTLLVSDRVPELLGESPHRVIGRLSPGERCDISTALHGSARGQYAVGPLSLTLRDPFGLCEVSRSFTTTDRVVVTPRVIDLPGNGLAGLWGGRGDSEARTIAHSGDDDVIPREYRTGDEIRRVHWRATARTGDLMVRREEQPWHTTATLVLDRRASSHRGRFPDTSLELAISIAASAAIHLSRLGLRVRVLDTTGEVLADSGLGMDAEALILDGLALVDSAGHGVLVDSAPLRRALDDGTLVAILGHLEPRDARLLADLRGVRGVAAALVVDAGAWDVDVAEQGGPESTAAILRRHGWRSAIVSPDRDSAAAADRITHTDQRIEQAWAHLSSAAVGSAVMR